MGRFHKKVAQMRFKQWMKNEADMIQDFGVPTTMDRFRNKNPWIKQAKQTMGLPPTASMEDLDKALSGPTGDPTKLAMIQKDIHNKTKIQQMEESLLNVEQLNAEVNQWIEEIGEALQGPLLKQVRLNISRKITQQEATVSLDTPTIGFVPSDSKLRYSDIQDPSQISGTNMQIAMLQEAHNIATRNYFSILELWKTIGWDDRRQSERKGRLGLNFPKMENTNPMTQRIFNAYHLAVQNFQRISEIEKEIGLDRLHSMQAVQNIH
jgi:hypothetical protein